MMIKFKIQIRDELLERIRSEALKFGFYDSWHGDDYKDERQSTEYHAFKQLVLFKEKLPESLHVPKHAAFTSTGQYLLSRFHVSKRSRILDSAKQIRNDFNLNPEYNT